MPCVHVDAHNLTVTTDYIFNERYKTPTPRVLLGTVCNSLFTKDTMTNSYVKDQAGLAVSESQQITACADESIIYPKHKKHQNNNKISKTFSNSLT